MAVTRTTAAQSVRPLDLGGAIRAGGEEERYLRVLQIAGLAPLGPWSIQPFSPSQTAELRHTKPNPWSHRFDTTDVAHVRALRPRAGLVENSTFPYEVNTGPEWDGRGITGTIQGGGAVEWKHFHAQFAPVAFLSQNAAFPLAPNGLAGSGAFADPRLPGNIDAPQRFGDQRYGRIDAGESFVNFDAHGVFAGVSSAANQWGPSRDFPLVLGPNAGGFPSVFVGTSHPADLWLFRLHARVVWGELGQSAFAPPSNEEKKRLGSGLVLDFLPRGIPGLEVGVTRFIHDPWPGSGFRLSSFGRPFAGGLNLRGAVVNTGSENQVASVFARWAAPAARAEFYGEFYKEDYPGHFHKTFSLVETPDDLASMTLGFQRALRADSTGVRVFRAELVNGETSHQERLERGFSKPEPPYVHTGGVNQGHTLNGMMLGAPDAYGGSGWRIGLDDYTPSGRRSLTFERSLRLDWLPHLGNSSHPDVIYALRLEWLRFSGKRDFGFTLVPAIDLNRDLQTRHDLFNLAAAVTVTGW